MRTQVYAVVYNANTYDFIIGNKLVKGYFFHKKGGGGVIIPDGKALNGGGLRALPGGELETENPVAGAMKEFFEETLVNLDDYTHMVVPNPYYMVYSSKWAYYGTYFQVANSHNILDKILAQAAVDLAEGALAKNAIIAGKYGPKDYEALRKAFPQAPLDNELSGVQRWNLVTDWSTIQSWQGDPNLGWFYNILNNLRNYLRLDTATVKKEGVREPHRA